LTCFLGRVITQKVYRKEVMFSEWLLTDV